MDIIWIDETNTEREAQLLSEEGNSDGTYDILLPERNVMIESIYHQDNIKKGNIVLYKKHGIYYDALVKAIDWASESLQVQVIIRNINPQYLFYR